MVILLIPHDRETVSLQTEHQKLFLENHEEYSENENWRDIIGAPQFCSAPLPVHFEWIPNGNNSKFMLSDTANFENVLCSAEADGKYDVYNLKAGKTYYWRVGESEIRSFATENNLPRMISAGAAAKNVRDIGGYNTLYGRRVRQGILYRGARFDLSKASIAEGRAALVDRLGLKYELDLRLQDEGPYETSPLGEELGYVRITTHSYDDFLENQGTNVRLIRFFIETIRDGKFPIYFHCAGGADRTGSVAMLILAVLGVSDDDILMDYEATSLCDFGLMSRHGERVSVFLKGLKKYGNTLHESLCAYLRVCGITDDEMSELRELMLEK